MRGKGLHQTVLQLVAKLGPLTSDRYSRATTDPEHQGRKIPLRVSGQGSGTVADSANADEGKTITQMGSGTVRQNLRRSRWRRGRLAYGWATSHAALRHRGLLGRSNSVNQKRCEETRICDIARSDEVVCRWCCAVAGPQTQRQRPGVRHGADRSTPKTQQRTGHGAPADRQRTGSLAQTAGPLTT